LAVITNVNYPTPVWVNGFECRNCSDVDLAKKHIDPEHPKSGPFNVDAKTDPTRQVQIARQNAIQFGGQLTGISTAGSGSAQPAATATGSQLDMSV